MTRCIAALTVMTAVLAGTTSVARAEDELPTPPKPEAPPPAAHAAPPPPEPKREQAFPPASKPPSPPASKPPPHCVGWGIAGALGGAAVGWYAAVGIAEAAGTSVFHSKTAFNVSIVAEGVGAVAGPIAACRLSKDPRIVPAASFVVLGAAAGGVALGLPTYFVLDSTRPFVDEDGPVFSALTLLMAITGGAFGGGYLGYLVSEAREPASRWDDPKPASTRSRWSVAPLVAKGAGGLVLGGAF
jgi:hypothetical protein